MPYDAVPLIPRRVLFGNPDRAYPLISPDGTRLAYLAPHEGVMNVYVRTLGQDDDHVVTSDKKRGIRSFAWQANGAFILYQQDRDGDEQFHLYQTDVSALTTKDLTPFEGARAQIVAADPASPHELLVGINNRDPHLFDVHRLNLVTGEITADTENPGDVLGWSADNALVVRTAQVMHSDGSTEIRARYTQDAGWKTLTRWGADESMGGIVGFTPDNSGVLLLSSVDANATRLLELDIASGQSRVIAEDAQYDVGGIMIQPVTHKLEAVIFERDREDVIVLDIAIQADVDALKRVRDGDWTVISRDLADRTWVVQYTVDDGPTCYYLYDRDARTATFLFTARPELENYMLAKMQPITYRARDGMTLHGYLTVPAGVEPRRLSTVLLVHGGPWARDSWGCSPFVQHLANRGYAVLQINFRGSTGYGKAYLNAGDREWSARMHDDLIDGKQWVIEQGIADPKRVAIMGGSYGGYAALVGLTFTPEEFVCGIDIVGPSSLMTLIRSVPPYWAPMLAMFTKRVGDIETEEEFLTSISPLFKAGCITKPLLIAQGANDPRVTQPESDQIVAAMREKGLPVEYLVFPDEGHGFARPENNLKFMAAAESFLARHLGGRAEPPTAAESVDDLRK